MSREFRLNRVGLEVRHEFGEGSGKVWRKVRCLGSSSDVGEGRGKIWGQRGIKEVLGGRVVFGFVVREVSGS